jgi:hypothetical protein
MLFGGDGRSLWGGAWLASVAAASLPGRRESRARRGDLTFDLLVELGLTAAVGLERLAGLGQQFTREMLVVRGRQFAKLDIELEL